MPSDTQWLENIDKQLPYVPSVANYRGRKKLPKFNKKDMLFKKHLNKYEKEN